MNIDPKAESAVSASRFPWLYLPRLAELREVSLPASRSELFTCFRAVPERTAMEHPLVKSSIIYKLDFRCSGYNFYLGNCFGSEIEFLPRRAMRKEAGMLPPIMSTIGSPDVFTP